MGINKFISTPQSITHVERCAASSPAELSQLNLDTSGLKNYTVLCLSSECFNSVTLAKQRSGKLIEQVTVYFQLLIYIHISPATLRKLFVLCCQFLILLCTDNSPISSSKPNWKTEREISTSASFICLSNHLIMFQFPYAGWQYTTVLVYH